MKNTWYWAKGYKYVKVPIFFRRWDLFGFAFIIKSHKTKRRRTGAKVMRKEFWEAYTKLLLKKK